MIQRRPSSERHAAYGFSKILLSFVCCENPRAPFNMTHCWTRKSESGLSVPLVNFSVICTWSGLGITRAANWIPLGSLRSDASDSSFAGTHSRGSSVTFFLVQIVATWVCAR
jgi:hypothetical protein